MTDDEARELIRDGVAPDGVWADLGAGMGTFTRALGDLLGPAGAIHAVDRNEQAVLALRRLGRSIGATLHVLDADFRQPLELPPLDGVLMANALHFVEDQEGVLRQIAGYLRPGGSLLLVEYDRIDANRWVPHPVSSTRFHELAAAVGLSVPRELGRRRSMYWRAMYAAVALTAGIGS